MDWDKLKSFHAAAETGSLTGAGERLGISQSAVSRQIAALEEKLGISLFQRHARGLVLTDSGVTLHQSTMEMEVAAKSAAAALQDQSELAQGDLIVTAPVAFGSTWLVPRLREFARQNPDLCIDLRLDDGEHYDLLKLEAECAIRLWAADKADLIQRKLATLGTNLYGSAEYLAKHGVPQTPADLDDHRIIAYGDADSPIDAMSYAQRIGRDDDRPRKAALTVNNVPAMARAVESGLGIADLPDYMLATMPDLVRVLEDYSGPSFELYFVYPSDLRRSKRIATFRDFLTSEVSAFSASVPR
ncbi:MAG: LysR family transcriptional regulator [Henriciella sp.]